MQRRQFISSGMALAGIAAMGGTPLAWAKAAKGGIADVNAVTLAGRETALTGAQLDELDAALRGNLLLPGNTGYDTARHVLNAAIDKYPALIVQPSGAADIGQAVQFARDNQLVIAVKCGGHSTAGKSTCNGGLMIDLSSFRHVRVDPERRRAWVSGGSLLGAMDHETMAHGLVTTAGTVSHTGVGGLTTGGGYGRLARRFGLALDNVTALDVVNADGRLRHASPEQNEDLYWGVRGAGSNFGVVTSFEFQLHPMERTVLAGNLVYPIEKLRDVLEFYGEYTPKWPDELYTDLVFGYPPGGKPGFVVLAPCYSGDPKQGAAALSTFDKLGKPMAGEIRAWDYVALQRSGDSTLPRATASYMKGGYTAEITPQLIDTILAGLEPSPDRSTQFIFQHAGGAVNRVPADATAFVHRYPEQNMILTLGWKPGTPGDAHLAAGRAFWKTLEPHTHGFYTVEVDDQSAGAMNRNYQGNFARLLEIKKRYDPDNNFRLNANISGPA